MAEQDHPPKSAEDIKAASALASLDSQPPSSSSPTNNNIDQEAVNKAIKTLSPPSTTTATSQPKSITAVKKSVVKVDPTDVALLVQELDLSKLRATEILKMHDGNAVEAMKAYVTF